MSTWNIHVVKTNHAFVCLAPLLASLLVSLLSSDIAFFESARTIFLLDILADEFYSANTFAAINLDLMKDFYRYLQLEFLFSTKNYLA